MNIPNFRLGILLFLMALYALPAHPAKTVKLEMHRGTPAINIDGEPTPPFLGMTYGPTAEYIAPFAEAGIRILAFNATADHTVYEMNRDVWLADGSYDYSEVFEFMDMYLAQDPEVQFLLRVYTSPPEWWCKAHPEEMLRDSTGSTLIERPEFVHGHSPRFTTASMASEKWISAAEENMARFVTAMEASPYGSHILAYHIAGGATEEWFNQHTLLPEILSDYSTPMRDAWRRWLRERYRTDRRLSKAWNVPGVALDTIELPSPERRRENTTTFRDPIKDVMLTDFYLFFQQVNLNVVRRLSATAKEACNNQKLVGAFFGYLFSLGPSAAESGHLAVKDALSIPSVDFFASPTCYGDRRVAHGYTDFMSATESVKLHGKLWLNENDIRTFLDLKTLMEKYPDYDNPAGYEYAYRAVGAQPDPAVTDEQLKLQLAATIGRGCGKWWFDITGGAYCDDRLIETIRHSSEVAATTFDLDRRSASEIALVVDDRSMLSLSYKHPLIGNTSDVMPQLGLIGAPFDAVLLDDLADIDLDRYKLLIFVNSYWIDNARAKTIRTALGKDGIHALFLYAPGVFEPNRPWKKSAKAMRKITGMKLNLDPGASVAPAVKLTPEGRKQLGVDSNYEMSPYGTAIMPVWCNDPDATALGLLADGRVGLARKDNVFFSASPVLDTTLLRAIARQSGVHLFVPQGDAVYATRAFIGVHTGPAPGPHVLEFQDKTIIHDLWNDVCLGTNSVFTLSSGSGKTHLFHYERTGNVQE